MSTIFVNQRKWSSIIWPLFRAVFAERIMMSSVFHKITAYARISSKHKIERLTMNKSGPPTEFLKVHERLRCGRWSRSEKRQPTF
ncbi:MAG: hypothetical protein NTZ38_02525, partial [Candidatus Taylorbacteria bacterium]|nr:hypothetical protein [Candidatus Taylorbacteria bacterium]